MRKLIGTSTFLCCAAVVGAVYAAAESLPPIIGGDLVPVPAQKDLGLVTVSTPRGTCSGSLLNRYWVLTASHCVSSNGASDGPDAPLNQTFTTATWVLGDAAPAKRFIRYFTTGYDVALIYLGANNLGPVKAHAVSTTAMMDTFPFTAYGRGIYGYATSPPDTQALRDGNYRMAYFQGSSSVSATGYSYPPNSRGQIIAGGDSGGPDWLASGAIAGVHSSCIITSCLAGHTCVEPDPWSWVTGIGSCTSARVDPIAADIQKNIKHAPCTGHKAACTEAVYAKLLLLQ